MHTILLVDDEPSVVEALTAQLMPLGVWIEGACSAEEALSLLPSNPAVIIADYLMPGMRGDEFLIQAHKQVPQARLILLTGQAGAENVGRVVNEARLFRYIAKPWEVEDLRLTVQEALRSYETEQHLQLRQTLTQQLLAYLQDLLSCETLTALAEVSEKWSQTLFGWTSPPDEKSLASLPLPTQEAGKLFSQTLALRQAHLQLIADLENQVQQRTAHLVATLQELKALSSQREAWIKIISHDLRGPLSGLRQLAALLQKGPLSPDNLSRYAQILEKSLYELETYVKNLLNLSRLSHKEIVLQPEPFSWKAMAERLHALIAPQLELKKIRWQVESDSEEGIGDPVYLTEALYNILSNAVKFTPVGGTVQFRVKNTDAGVLVEITDTGIGMSEEEIASLWDPTKRRSRVGTAGEKGTGLGLPLARTILEQHGVRIQVASAPGKGTTFQLLWPKV